MGSHKMEPSEKTTRKGYDKNRIKHLARPKVSKQEYLTNFNSSQCVWGDKDGMWTISPAALKAKCTPALDLLAKPKESALKNEVHLYTYSCGRQSPIQKHINKHKDNKIREVNYETIKRLAKPKHPHGSIVPGKLWTYSCGRESPIWNMSRSKIINRPSTADKRLALPKLSHGDFQPNRELRQDGRLPARFIQKLKSKGDSLCTERLENLSQPKTSKAKDAKWAGKKYLELGRPEKSIRPVYKECLEYQASDIIENLAKPNDSRFKKYKTDRFEWPVSRNALRHKITPRIDEMATPVVRPSMEHTQYDMNAFFVKPAALKAKCTNRLQELALPTNR